MRIIWVCLVIAGMSGELSASQWNNTPSLFDAVRFLRQSSFGPTWESIERVQGLGFDGFLAEQFSAPMSEYPDLGLWPQTRPQGCTAACQRDNYSQYALQRHFFSNALYGKDQLRQRVAFALGQILVISSADVPLPSWMRPYQQLLYQGAFGNFRQLLFKVTLNPAMGRYLDMVNNRCQTRTPADPSVCRAGLAVKPNENYAREILQLFSIGTFQLRQDGTLSLDTQGNPMPTYDQTTIEEFSRVFTGWVSAPNLPGPPEAGGTVSNYVEPMRAREDYHDRGPKTLLDGLRLPGGQSAQEELDAALDNIAYHPNVAPFISRQLIQKLVTSNPSPEYVARVVAVWNAHWTSDYQLEAVVRTILTDLEARGGIKPEPNYGKLSEPVLFVTNFLRAFNATSDGVLNSLSVSGFLIGTSQMGQDVFQSPTVFNFFRPEHKVPGEEDTLGPEFEILSTITALRRANFVNRVVMNAGGIPPAPPDRPAGTQIDFSGWTPLAGDPDWLIESLNWLMLNGTMPEGMRETLRDTLSAIPVTDELRRVRTAVYLIATSSHYQVQR